MAINTDILIVGGGIMGSAAAYYLASSEAFNGSITVIERDATYSRASTPRSAGGVRQQFSIRENVEIGLYARQFIDRASELLAVDDPVDLGFVEAGYLFLAGPEGRQILKDNHQVQTEAGADISWLEPEELGQRFPYVNLDGVSAACFGERGEGWMDPNTLLQAFRKKARALGVTYIEDEVTAIERRGIEVKSATLASGEVIEFGRMIVSAGANSGAVMRMMGLDLPVGPRKRVIYQFDCREELSPKLPLTIDPSGVFVRTEGKGFICGVSPPEEHDPETWDMEVDWRWYEELVWPAIAHRIPAFEAIKLTGAWAGFYDYNALDQNAIVGPHPMISNLLVATGFSGHGFQQGPAIGRALMELVTTGSYQTIDLTRFGVERILNKQPLFEQNVV